MKNKSLVEATKKTTSKDTTNIDLRNVTFAGVITSSGTHACGPCGVSTTLVSPALHYRQIIIGTRLLFFCPKYDKNTNRNCTNEG
jgi:hypothetical protein